MYGFTSHTVFPELLLLDDDGRQNSPKDQNATRPDIDEVICNTLDGDTLKDALNFVDNIRASKMKIEWSSVNVWSVHRGFKHIMDITVVAGTWSITLLLDHNLAGDPYISTEMEGVKKLINSFRSSLNNQKVLKHASN